MSTSATAGPTGPSSGTGLSAAVDLSPKSRPGERVITVVLQLSAYASIAITFGIIAALIQPVTEFFGEVPFGDFFAFDGTYAVLPLVTATLMVTLIALLVAVPLGAWLRSERVSPLFLAGAAVVMVGVYLGVVVAARRDASAAVVSASERA